MWNRIYELESEKFDFMEYMKHQKYEVEKWNNTHLFTRGNIAG